MSLMKLKGKAISFEGGEGAGKSTVITMLETYLKEQGGLDVIKTREPGGSEIAEQIREVIVDKKNTKIAPETECLLYTAARAQLMNEKIFPLLKEDKTLIFDRFADSTYVYQGMARELGVEKVMELTKFATKGWMPDITFVLDIDPKIGLERIRKNNRETNRLDDEPLDFHYKIREGYLKLHEKFPERIYVIDANQTPDRILQDILTILEAKQF